MTQASATASSRPFGQIEGAYAEIRPIRSGFIEFDGLFSDVAISPQEQDIRILVGRMGTGKSINLRRLQDHHIQELEDGDRSVYTAGYSQQAATALTTINVRYFSQAFGRNDLTEMWKLLWRRAIFRAAVSHLLNAEAMIPYTETADIPILRSAHPLLSDQGTPTDIASEAQMIIESVRQVHPRAQRDRTQHALLSFLQAGDWTRIEHEVLKVLSNCPPMYFYIDAVDDEFRAAPSYWLRSQKGLFYQIYTMLRDDRWRERLHIIAAVRHHVLSSVYSAEGGHKYLNENHHRVLKWTRDAIGYFLDRKIADLDGEWLMAPQASTPIARWLGMPSIQNEDRGVVERLDDYLIRHTRATPRDIVQMGNQLSQYVRQLKAGGYREADPVRVREIVSGCARDAAQFELNHCGNQINTDLGRNLDDTERYRGEQEFPYNETTANLRHLLVEMRHDRFEWNDVDALRRRGRDAFASADLDLPTILWQNGLLGYADRPIEESAQRRCHFYVEPTVGSAVIPEGRTSYVLHPIVLDCIPELEPIGPPIEPILSSEG